MATEIDPTRVPAQAEHTLRGEQLAVVLYALDLLNDQCPLEHSMAALLAQGRAACLCDQGRDLYNEIAEPLGLTPLD